MIERLPARALDGAPRVAELDDGAAVDAPGAAVEVDAAEPATAPAGPGVAELLALPPVEHLTRRLDAGATTAALARVAARQAVPGELAAEARLREVAARYLALRLEVAQGMARISMG